MSSRHQLSRNPSARSFTAAKLLRAAAPVAVALLGSLWLVGCDTPANQDDRKVQADVASAQAALDRGTADGVAQAEKTLEGVVADSEPTPLTRATAKGSLGQIEQNDASQIMRQIDGDDATLHLLINEISALARQVDASRAVAAGYDKYDPKPAQDAIAAEIAAAQGGPNNLVWVKQDNSSVPSLAAVTQTISQLQGQIAKQSDDLKALQNQRTQVLDDADQADKSSAISKDQQSVDDFKRAADLRKQAGDLTVQIEKNQAQTIPLQKDLEVAQGQQVVLQEVIKQLQDQSQLLDTGWKSIQDAVAAQAVLQKQIVAGNGEAAPAPATAPSDTGTAAASAAGILPSTGGPSLNDKAETLGKLVEQLASERSDALSHLNSAITHYSDAAKAGAEYSAALDLLIRDPGNTQRAEQDAWKNLQAVAAPAVYKMKAALAQRQLAELYVSEVINLSRRSQLEDEVGKILGAVNIPIPPALVNPGLDQAKKTAADSAADAYAKAEKELDDIKEGQAPDLLKKLARVQDVFTQYGQVQLARAIGDTATARDKLSAAAASRDDALQAGLQLPPLPPELVPSPTPPAAPGSAPPATPPS